MAVLLSLCPRFIDRPRNTRKGQRDKSGERLGGGSGRGCGVTLRRPPVVFVPWKMLSHRSQTKSHPWDACFTFSSGGHWSSRPAP